jgi:hypothetical protein
VSLSIDSTQLTSPVQLPAANFHPVGLPSGASPEQNAQWWNGLSAHERVGYLADHGSEIGSMDGLPSEIRHAANMETLREDARSGDEGAQSLLARIDESRSTQDPSGHLYLLEFTPADPASNWFDTKTDATAVVAISNPDLADNVAVFVPGTGSTVDSIGSNIDRMDALKSQAELLDDEAATSTIVWLGYDAPDNVVGFRGPDATAIGPALDGAPALREFTHGLRASSEGNTPANLTVIGHSYGSTVVGYADRSDRSDGLGADNIIVAGSPGLSVHSADQLSIDNGSLWTAMADDDPIRHTPTFIHGTNPVNEGFGGTRIDNGGASGHSGYWTSGSESLRNQGYIVTGNEHMVSTREFR